MNRYEIIRRDVFPRVWYIWDYVKGGAVCDFFGDVAYYDTPEEAKEELEELNA
jgi:hypothetical protein